MSGRIIGKRKQLAQGKLPHEILKFGWEEKKTLGNMHVHAGFRGELVMCLLKYFYLNCKGQFTYLDVVVCLSFNPFLRFLECI